MFLSIYIIIVCFEGFLFSLVRLNPAKEWKTKKIPFLRDGRVKLNVFLCAANGGVFLVCWMGL